MAKKRADSDAIGVLRELEEIKRLLIFALLRNGASQAEVAKALGVSQPSISRMFPGAAGKATKGQRQRR
ncbi:MAG: hypothetical protein KatS3mg081_2162 [Gemmatimonadales bacterium]|nr:MAG: hypothetical protein KatS3mg081_2162 [Gemmatimonadales bacterium]